MTDTAAALAAAVERAQEAADLAEGRLGQVRREARERADRFAGITVASGVRPATIRELADQVRLADPAAVEAAEIEVARAELAVADARIAEIEPTRPARLAEMEEAARRVKEAQIAAGRAHAAYMNTFPGQSGMAFARGQASERLHKAMDAAREGAEHRLAELMGKPSGDAA